MMKNLPSISSYLPKFLARFVPYLDQVLLGYARLDEIAALDDGGIPPIAGGVVPAARMELLPGNEGDCPAALLLLGPPYGGTDDLERLLTLLL